MKRCIAAIMTLVFVLIQCPLTANAASDIVASGLIGNYSADDAGGYKYLTYVYFGDIAAENKYLQLTYTGDISTLRMELRDGSDAAIGTYWFAPEQASKFVTADGSAIPTNVATDTTIKIDLAASGIDVTQMKAGHLHYLSADLTSASFSISDARFVADTVTPPSSGSTSDNNPGGSVSDNNPNVNPNPPSSENTGDADIVLDGVEGADSMIGSYSASGKQYEYLGYASLKGVTNEYGFLQLTYTGDISTLRLEFARANGSVAGPWWFVADQAMKFKTADGSAIPTNVSSPTTIKIDLAATGINIGEFEGVHMHYLDPNSQSGSFTISDARFVKGTGNASNSGSSNSGSGSGAVAASAPVVVANGDDIVLNGDGSESSFIGDYSASGAEYKYLGFATLKGVTSDYRYLKITYTGDISTLRLEMSRPDNSLAGPWWFAADQAVKFVTVDGKEIPTNVSEETTIIIDLVASGINIGEFNGMHLHYLNPDVQSASFSIKDARFIGGNSAAPKTGTSALPTAVACMVMLCAGAVLLESRKNK